MKIRKRIQKKLGASFMENKHFVYILQCKDLSLYTGYTVDLENRLLMHERGKGAKYTRGRGPFQVVYKEEFTSKGDALRREIEIKKMRRHEKIALISTNKKGVKHASTKKFSR